MSCARTFGWLLLAVLTAAPARGQVLVRPDVAPLAVYVASEEGRMVTGQSYNIDGGIVLAG